MKTKEWIRAQIQKSEKDALDLTARVNTLVCSFQSCLQELPRLLRASEKTLREAENEFQERAYDPFWDKIEEAAKHLDSFNFTLRQMEFQIKDFYQLLQGRIHNFPSLDAVPSGLPNPVSQLEHLRRLIRMGQKDIDFVTIWHHRKTQQILLKGFRTLREAVDNLGYILEESSARLTNVLHEGSERIVNTIRDSSGAIQEEQIRLRLGFEEAVQKWEAQKRLYEAKN